jgi:hypothetical protein
MPSFVWLILGLFVAWIVIVAVIGTLLVKSGRFKLKKGGAPGTSSGGGFDAGSSL